MDETIQTIKKIEDPAMILLWEISERIEYANSVIRSSRKINTNDSRMLGVDKESLIKIEGEPHRYADSIVLWAPNLRKKIEILLGEDED